ncbi:MAG: hypothetical protein VB068_03430, partial [Petrimonas sp.]|nr:hypothetical protein [Petrimonas sp.]
MIYLILSKLITCLLPNFERLGFKYKKSVSEFRKTLINCNIVAIGVDLLPASSHGYYKAAITAHIHIKDLEDVYITHHPFIKPNARKAHYTISVNCDNIFKDKTVSQSYQLHTDKTITALSEILWAAISDDVLPFLEKFSDRKRLVENLLTDDYNKWVTSNRLVRYCVLISDRVLAHDELGFEKFAEELLDYCMKPYGAMYLS